MNEIDKQLKGEAFLVELSFLLAKELGSHSVLLGIATHHNTAIETLVCIQNSERVENFKYDIKDTPCHEVFIGDRVCIYPKQVANHFPKDQLLVDLNIESYVGTSLLNMRGGFEGVLLAIDTKPIEDAEFASALYEFAAQRASLELKLMRAEENFNASEEFLNDILQQRDRELKNTLGLLEKEKIELQSSLRLRNKLLSTIVHDLSNPLMAASTNIQLFPSVKMDRKIQNAEIALNEAIDITRKVRDIFKMGLDEEKASSVFMAEVIEYSELVFSKQLENKKLVLSKNLEPDLQLNTVPTIFKNSIFNNILSNSIKFSPRGSEILVESSAHDQNFIDISITDQAGGIDIDILKEIETDSAVLHSTLGTEQEEGSGLGLKCAIDHIKSLGGEFFIEKTDYKSKPGTRFTLRMPRL